MRDWGVRVLTRLREVPTFRPCEGNFPFLPQLPRLRATPQSLRLQRCSQSKPSEGDPQRFLTCLAVSRTSSSVEIEWTHCSRSVPLQRHFSLPGSQSLGVWNECLLIAYFHSCSFANLRPVSVSSLDCIGYQLSSSTISNPLCLPVWEPQDVPSKWIWSLPHLHFLLQLLYSEWFCAWISYS